MTVTVPGARRVAKRAVVLATMFERAELEKLPDRTAAEAERQALCDRVTRLELGEEMEPEERFFLSSPLGARSDRTLKDARWRLEGAGVLAWAIGVAELPRYDVPFELARMRASPEDLIANARFRAREEIHQLLRTVQIVRYRLVQWLHEGRRARHDYRTFLERHPCSWPEWFADVAFDAGGELLVSGQPVCDLGENEARACARINLERHVAIDWLYGDATRYAEIAPAAVLSGFDPPRPEIGDEFHRRDRAARADEERRVEKKKEAVAALRGTSDAELVAKLVALGPKLKPFERILIGDLQRALATGALSDGQRVRVAEIIEDRS